VAASFDVPLDCRFPEIVLRGASRLNPALKTYFGRLPRGMNQNGGWYTRTRDTWPLIGGMGPAGVFMNCAMSGHGTMKSCAAGALAAAWVAGGDHPDYAPAFSLARFRDPTLVPDAHWTHDNQALADRSDVVIVSVRPQDWPAIAVSAPGKLVISVMAGVRLAELAAHLGTSRIVRALPNAAAEVGKSYTPWTATAQVMDGDRATVRRLLHTFGTEDEVATEAEMDYMAGLSGTGPAYPALLAVAMMRHAVAHGLPPEVVRRAVVALFVGTGRLFERGDDPADTVRSYVEIAA
jgi:pyrroline-5-carboxylate reductase